MATGTHIRSSQEKIEDLTFETLIKKAFKDGNSGACELHCLSYGLVLEQREAEANAQREARMSANA